MPVLVTGATGFLGRHLVPLLAGRDGGVRALVRPATDAAALTSLGVDMVRGDVLDPESLARAADGCAAVVNLAGLVSYERRDRERQLAVNVEGVRRLLGTVDPAARVLHVSSVAAVGPVECAHERAAEGHPYDPRADRYVYPETKRLGEALALQAAREGRDVLVANPGFLIGPGDVYRVSTWAVRRYLQGALRVIVPGGLSYVDARDVAAGLVALLDRGRPGERTILTSRDGNLSHREFFGRVARVTGVRRRELMLSAGAARAGATLVPWPVKPGEVAAAANWWFYDPGKAERELGFATRPLDETIAATAAQYR